MGSRRESRDPVPLTSLWNLKNVGPENILAVGLKPFAIVDWYDELGLGTAPDGIWLTSKPDYDPTTTPAKTMSSGSEVRITVVIPSSDKRLVRWERWLRKHHRDLVEGMAKASDETGIDWRAWYVYFGAVPLSMFRAVEHADAAGRAAAS